VARLLKTSQAIGHQFAAQKILHGLSRKKTSISCLFSKSIGKGNLDGGHVRKKLQTLNLSRIRRQCFQPLVCPAGSLHDDSPWIHREGVLWHEPSQTDLLFVTLHRSEALFSPSTCTRDLALGPSLFHWESHEGERPMAIHGWLERAIPAEWMQGVKRHRKLSHFRH